MDTQIVPHNDPAALLLAMIQSSPKLADSTKEKYQAAVLRYLEDGGDVTDAAQLEAHAADLPQSGRSFLKAAVRLLTERLATEIKRRATSTNLAHVQASLLRIEALQQAIHVEQPKGHKSHIWLSADEVQQIMNTFDDSPKGRRDRVILALLFGAGLRREEAAGLTFEAVNLLPIGGKLRTVLDVKGKGAKDRVIPVSDELANILSAWRQQVGDGRICRSLKRNGELRQSMSAVGIFNVVRQRGALIGRPELAAHDCRRTYAQIGWENLKDLYKVSHLLGHESIDTTARYLDLKLDLDETISDYVPLG